MASYSTPPPGQISADDTHSFAYQLEALGFDDDVLITLNKNGVEDITELADLRDMEIRQKAGLTLVNARRLAVVAKDEQKHRAEMERARARAAAQAKEAEVYYEESLITSPHHGLQDPELVKILQSGSMVREARARPCVPCRPRGEP